MNKLKASIQTFYSILCTILVFGTLWSFFWFFCIRMIIRIQDGFLFYLIALCIVVIAGIYYGYLLRTKYRIKNKELYISNMIVGSLILLPILYISYWIIGVSTIFSSSCAYVENQKVMSSHEFYATYLTENCGATTYFTEKVHVDKTQVFSAQIRSTIKKPLVINWINGNTLSVSLSSTDINDVCIFNLKKDSYTPLNGEVKILYDSSILNANCSRFENKNYSSD